MYLCFAMVFYFQYHFEAIKVYINDTFINALKEGNSEKFKNMFDKFSGNLKKQGTKTDAYVERLTEQAANKIQEHQNEEQVRDEILSLIMYKTKHLNLCCCSRACSISIPEGNYSYAQSLNRYIRIVCNSCFVLEVLFTAFDFYMTSKAIKDGETVSTSEIVNFNYLDYIQIALTCVVIYTIMLYQQMNTKIRKRDDPFSNGTIYSFVIFMVILQKYLVELVFYKSLEDENSMMVVTVIRQTLMSIELLFIQIPFRHNFSLNYIEG
eukprot:CAMPEP_0202958592 /NCGR_PEP_ID=MMETSP1396-20130829/2898_1 /ASSEMBLY_ACC=CAM_ASM_000872 /TAXON_ID= /ORGANISM="Pseudokeronopsis sp., Strain Brazil" /LENGTH=265 /DNA_ID=CAMNT_0049676743 /DNA_START=366 /DNA_END=1163 /DNA_ORIENTATION=+